MLRRHIPKAVKEQPMVLSGHLSSDNIAWATEISKSTVNQVLKLKCETGSVVCNPHIMGDSCLLNGLDIAVCLKKI